MSWTDRINPQVHFAWSGIWKPGAVEPRRTLLDHELVVFLQGDCVVELSGRQLACPADSFLVVPPGRPHLTRAARGAVLRHCVHFDWRWQGPPPQGPIWAYWPEPLAPGRLRRAPGFVPRRLLQGRIGDGSPVPGLLRSVSLRWNTGDAVARASCRALLLEALLRLLTPAAPVPAGAAKQDLAFAARDVLDGLDPNTTSVQTALAGLGCTYEHACRSFHQRFGISPLRYVNAVRLERATRLLRDSDAEVAAVARQAGFRDPGYFARLFRAYTGTTPVRFRARR